MEENLLSPRLQFTSLSLYPPPHPVLQSQENYLALEEYCQSLGMGKRLRRKKKKGILFSQLGKREKLLILMLLHFIPHK